MGEVRASGWAFVLLGASVSSLPGIALASRGWFVDLKLPSKSSCTVHRGLFCAEDVAHLGPQRPSPFGLVDATIAPLGPVSSLRFTSVTLLLTAELA